MFIEGQTPFRTFLACHHEFDPTDIECSPFIPPYYLLQACTKNSPKMGNERIFSQELVAAVPSHWQQLTQTENNFSQFGFGFPVPRYELSIFYGPRMGFSAKFGTRIKWLCGLTSWQRRSRRLKPRDTIRLESQCLVTQKLPVTKAVVPTSNLWFPIFTSQLSWLSFMLPWFGDGGLPDHMIVATTHQSCRTTNQHIQVKG